MWKPLKDWYVGLRQQLDLTSSAFCPPLGLPTIPSSHQPTDNAAGNLYFLADFLAELFGSLINHGQLNKFQLLLPLKLLMWKMLDWNLTPVTHACHVNFNYTWIVDCFCLLLPLAYYGRCIYFIYFDSGYCLELPNQQDRACYFCFVLGQLVT